MKESDDYQGRASNCKVLIVAASMLLTIFATFDYASATYSDSDQWGAFFPEHEARLNQTLTSIVTDTHASLALATDIWHIANGSTTAGQRELAISISALGNTRMCLSYGVPSSPSSADWPTGVVQYPSTSTIFEDDEGLWVYLPGETRIHYFGAWYDSLYVTSNGYVVLGANKGIVKNGTITDSGWISPPSSLPSSIEPNCVVAPFWTDLDSGTVRWGTSLYDGTGLTPGGLFFWVTWDHVRDKSESRALQTFSVCFPLNDEYVPIDFVYGSITDDAPRLAGYENQDGSIGGTLPTPETNGKSAYLKPVEDDWHSITDITVFAKPLAGSWGDEIDPDAYVCVEGPYGSRPGGFNVDTDEYFPMPEGPSDPSIFTVAGFALGMVTTLTCPPVGTIITASYTASNYLVWGLGNGLDALAYVDALKATPRDAVFNSSDEGTEGKAYALCPANDGGNSYAWDVGAMPVFIWHINEDVIPDGAHRLLVWASMTIKSPETYLVSGYPATWSIRELETTPQTLTIGPSGSGENAKWLGRTYPDGCEYDFQTIPEENLPPGLIPDESWGYQIAGDDYDGIYGDDSYEMFGWTTLSADPSEGSQIVTRSDGCVRIEGMFRQSDLYDDSLGTLNAYTLPMRPEFGGDFGAIIAQEPDKSVVLNPSEKEYWFFRTLLLDVGMQFEGLPVKVGVGKTVYPGNGHEIAEWAGVRVLDQSKFGLYISTNWDEWGPEYGGYTGAWIDEEFDGNYLYPRGYSWPGDWTDDERDVRCIKAVPYPNFIFTHWEITTNGVTEYWYDDFLNVTMGEGDVGCDRFVKACFDIDPGPQYYTVTVTVSPADAAWTNPPPKSPGYLLGEHETFTAYPETQNGWRFDHWLFDGNVVFGPQFVQGTLPGSATIDITVTANHTIVACCTPIRHFERIWTQEMGDGTTDPAIPPLAQAYWDLDYEFDMTAVPAVGFAFDHWILDGVTLDEETIHVTMSINHTVEIWFIHIDYLTVKAYDAAWYDGYEDGPEAFLGSIQVCNESGVPIYGFSVQNATIPIPREATVTVRAGGGNEYAFEEWHLHFQTYSPQPWPHDLTFEMDGNHTLIGTFWKLHAVSVGQSILGIGAIWPQPDPYGTTDPSPDTVTYVEDWHYFLASAVPVNESRFAYWQVIDYETGEQSRQYCDSAPYLYCCPNVCGNMRVVAVWQPKVDLEVYVHNGMGTVSPELGFHENEYYLWDTVTASATPDPGYVFSHWILSYEGCPGPGTTYYGNPATIQLPYVYTNTLTAVFAPESAYIHNIDTDLDYESIQEAIDAPETENGHTLMIDEGTHFLDGNVQVNKSLTIMGSSSSATVIDCQWQSRFLIEMPSTFRELTIINGFANILVITSQSVIERNTLIGSNYAAIVVTASASGTQIVDNIIEQSDGISISGCDCMVRNNTIVAGRVYCAYTDNVTVSNCTLTDSGIYVDWVIGSSFTENIISGSNSYGIKMRYSIGNLVRGNQITQHDCTYHSDGVYMYRCNDTIVTQNSVENYDCGVYLSGDNQGLQIYYNNFISNGLSVSLVLPDTANVWDDGVSAGNYWSDYSGVDDDSDGIGDDPYEIRFPNERDRYPLMSPWTPSSGSPQEFELTVLAEYIDSKGRVKSLIGAKVWINGLLVGVTGDTISTQSGIISVEIESPFKKSKLTLTFDYWVDDGSTYNPRTLNLDSDMTITARYSL